MSYDPNGPSAKTVLVVVFLFITIMAAICMPLIMLLDEKWYVYLPELPIERLCEIEEGNTLENVGIRIVENTGSVCSEYRYVAIFSLDPYKDEKEIIVGYMSQFSVPYYIKW